MTNYSPTTLNVKGIKAKEEVEINGYSLTVDTNGKLQFDNTELELASTAVTHTESTAAGSTSQPVYIASNGVATPITYKFWVGTQSDYDDITTKDTDTIYFIKESQS